MSKGLFDPYLTPTKKYQPSKLQIATYKICLAGFVSWMVFSGGAIATIGLETIANNSYSPLALVNWRQYRNNFWGLSFIGFGTFWASLGINSALQVMNDDEY